MKEKITLTIESELLAVIEKQMRRCEYNNRSKFLEYSLREIFFSPQRKLKFYEGIVHKKARELGELSKYVHELQEKVEKLEQTEEIIEKGSEKDEMFANMVQD